MSTLSIVLPNYNHGAFLPRCLDSLLEQTPAPTEILICDDGSTDNSLEVLASYVARHPHIRLLKNEQNVGVMATLDRLQAEARSEYIFFLAADDYVLPGFMQAATEGITAKPSPAIVFFDVEFDRAGCSQPTVLRFGGPAGPRTPEQIVARYQQLVPYALSGNATICRRDQLRPIWGHALQVGPLFDVLYCCFLAFRFGGYYVPGSYSRLEVQPESYSRSLGNWRTALPIYKRVLQKLHNPEFADVRDRFRRSNLFSRHGPAFLLSALSDRRDWDLLTHSLLWRVLLLQISTTFRRFLPRVYSWLTKAVGYGAAARQRD